MEVKVSAPKPWLRELEIRVPFEELSPIFEQAYKKYKTRVQINGFRKGKVPLEIIKRMFGRAIEEVTIDEKIIPRFYKQAMQRENLKPVDVARIEEVSYDRTEGLRFKAKVEVEPDVQPVGYKGIKVKKEIYEVTEEDVEEALEKLREQYATVRPVEDQAKEGDYILADFQELDSTGVPVVGKKWENRYFQLGSDELDQQLNQQLIGVRPNEERVVVINSPEDYKEREGEVQPRRFSVKVKEVEDKELPELDDEFAKDVGDYETLDELKADLRKELEEEKREEARERLREELIDEVVKNNDFELPPAMLNTYFELLFKNMRKDSEEPIDEELIRDQYRPIAIRTLKWHILYHKIAEREGIEVTEEEVEERVKELFQKRRPPHQERDRIREDLLEEKVLDFLEQNAVIEEVVLRQPEGESKIIIP